MKTACKNNKLALTLLMGGCLLAGNLVVSSSFAADPGPSPSSALPPAPPMMIAPPANLQKPDNPTPITPAPAATEVSLPIPASPKNISGKSIDAMDVKVPDSVKDTMKKLNTAENLTLDDLNSARQTIAKIDVMIEIEKKLTELDKLRQDRDGVGAKPLAAAIPASAISPLPAPSLPQFTPPALPSLPLFNKEPQHVSPPPVSTGTSGDISRIIGTGGHYAAMVKNGDQTKIVQVGDHFDGATVLSISATGVQVEDGKATRTIHVKNVENVFSDSN